MYWLNSRRARWSVLVFFVVVAAAVTLRAYSFTGPQPSTLVLYDGPDTPANPARLDANYLANLLGHFTTRRKLQSLETYKSGEMERYDAIFTIIYQKKYQVPAALLQDVSVTKKIFCWLGNQTAQLERRGILRAHGLAFDHFTETIPLTQVTYKGQIVDKGDTETNLLRVLDSDKVTVVATVAGPKAPAPWPYIVRNGSFWIVADSPFSYSSEHDRYLVFCDVLHDILGINHPEDHRAMIRIEDLNALSEPHEMQATLDVLRHHHIPFAFGYVPTYINPHDRLELRMGDKPDVVHMLQKYVASGGSPVLHGFTHQYRGVTTDDYEFWDDLGDRPVRGDSEAFAAHRIEEAIKESLSIGIYPITWETPHYAGSETDYRVFRRYFNTVFERRLVGRQLGTDQMFPYPVVDMLGQYVIPENLAYVEIDDPKIEPLLVNAEAAKVVRDGYASAFFHPFLKPALLDRLIAGIKEKGYHFVDLRSFPNQVQCDGRVISTASGPIEIAGRGRFLHEFILDPEGDARRSVIREESPTALIHRDVRVKTNEVYVALRLDTAPPGFWKKLLQLAKGDLSVFQRRIVENVFASRPVRNPMKTALLWNHDAVGAEAIDQQSFFSAFSSLGFDLERVDASKLTEEDLGPFTLLVVPQSAARRLKTDTVLRITGALMGGITLVTDGESPLSEALGIRLGEPEPTSRLQDHFLTNQETRWPEKPSVHWIAEPRAEDADVYYSDADQQHPLVIGMERGEGRFLYMAPLFDPVSGQGYARFPNVAQILLNQMHVRPIVHREGAEAYFDPGYRQTISIEVLARMWRRFGIRAVHVAGWGFYDKYSYDYARLIKVAHQNGILVYAWFEFPHVSQKFWNKHPLWRDKTATLAEAHIDWRYLMNLQDPQCLKAVLQDMTSFLKDYDWDGVNLGELTFESPSGPENPATMTPFNAQARQAFKARGGFDPIELFQESSPHFWKEDRDGLKAFYDFRRDENTRLLKTFLEVLARLRTKDERPWDLVVTVLDALQHPELSDFLGIDLNRTVALINHHQATLQVEDPAADWAKGPERYTTLGKRYSELKLVRPFAIDINVLPVHSAAQHGFATAQPTGIELAQLWRTASAQAPRVCLYAESTIFEQDWYMLPYAMAASASVHKDGDDWIVRTPNTVRLDVGREPRRYRLDDKAWYAVDKGEVLIPAGEHRLTFAGLQRSWFDTTQLQTKLLSITGELLDANRVSRGLDVEYFSPHRCAMVFSKLPYSLYLDGQSVKLPVIRGDQGFTVLAPPGRHQLRVISETFGLYFVEFVSLVTASLIVLFGLLSSGLLAVLFLVIVISRRLRQIRWPSRWRNVP